MLLHGADAATAWPDHGLGGQMGVWWRGPCVSLAQRQGSALRSKRWPFRCALGHAKPRPSCRCREAASWSPTSCCQ